MKFKRIIAVLLITVMLMTSMVTYADKTIGENALSIIKNQLEVLRLQAENVQSFVAILKDLIPLVLKELKDVKESDWFKENLALLYGMKIVEGNGEGFFLPNKEVTGSEYLKMVVVALDNKNYAPVDGQWDKPYIDRALQLGLVKNGEIADYRKPLNRYQMARIIVRACDEEYSDYNIYQSNIKDFNSIPFEFRAYVLKAYSKGIINGLPDGTFGGDRTMRRSEATAVIARLIDPNQRVTPQKSVNDGTKSYDGVSFNPTIDVLPDGRMAIEKSSEFIERALDNLVFYKENGKYYVKMTYPDLPEEYKASLSIMLIQNNGKPGCDFTTGFTMIEEQKIPSSGSFVRELKGLKSISEIDYMKIHVSIPMVDVLKGQKGVSCSYRITYVPNSPSDTDIELIETDTGNGKDAGYDFMKIFKW